MTAYYNEIDPAAAAWLRALISEGHIAPGIVDERSIEDVYPSDLHGFTQCHFFAGIGVWSYALRRAGWSDDRPVWTGSCPCQPFSAAGKGAAFADERHLWPAFHHLILQCKPARVFGEQVASKDADAWIDLVHTDLEALGYAFGAVPFPSAGVGAPHIRDRTYWVGQSTGVGCEGKRKKSEHRKPLQAGEGFGWLANLYGDGRDQAGECLAQARRHGAVGNGAAGGLAYLPGSGRGEERAHAGGIVVGDCQEGFAAGSGDGDGTGGPGPVNGFWAAADWLGCRDGKWRPVEPGTFPLAHGAPARVGRLRGYGNAINAVAAQVFIESVMEAA